MTRIGFIGAGDISLLHGQAITDHPNATLAGIWNITPELAKEKSARFCCKVYESAEELVGDPEIDAIFILTVPEAHAKYAKLAMEAGKHVLVEKPVAMSLEELEDLKATAESHKVMLMPGHNYIHEDGLRRTRDLIDAGKLGDLVQIHIYYNIDHPEEVACRYPGVTRQILIHHAYILLYLAGIPASVYAKKTTLTYDQHPEDDLAMVTLEMKNGALAQFVASFAADDHSADPWSFYIKVIGTKGATRFSYNDWIENAQAIVHSHTYSAYHYHVRDEVKYFIDQCVGQGVAPPSTIDDAIVCQKIIEACEQSAEEKREISIS